MATSCACASPIAALASSESPAPRTELSTKPAREPGVVKTTQAIDANVPTNSQFVLDLSRVREKQGDFKGALEAMERYVTLVQQQGQKPAWCDERLAELRAKAQ